MTEKEKMLSGLPYNALDPELVKNRERARLLFQRINAMSESEIKERDALFYELLGSAGKKLWIEPPFYCDYGSNIQVGDHVFMNYNCCILDVGTVQMGNTVLLGPNVQIYTATHPMDAASRRKGIEMSKPVKIGNDVWIGGGAIINPGVTLGNGVVVGSGAVVTKSFSDNVFIAGDPARVVRKIE